MTRHEPPLFSRMVDDPDFDDSPTVMGLIFVGAIAFWAGLGIGALIAIFAGWTV